MTEKLMSLITIMETGERSSYEDPLVRRYLSL